MNRIPYFLTPDSKSTIMLGKVVVIAVSLPDSASVAPLHRMRFNGQMISLKPRCHQRFLHGFKSLMKLFISGIPGSGKTSFADWLRDEFGFMHIDFELLSEAYQQ